MSNISYDNNEKLLHRARHLWSAEVIQKSDGQGATIIIKRVPFRIKRNILFVVFIKHCIKREGDFLREIMVRAPGISPKVLYAVKGELVMEQIKGATLFECCDKIKVQTEFYNKLKNTILKLHDLGIGHGEIRLGNIFINEAGEMLLVDFAQAVGRTNPLFKTIVTLDLLALFWIKKNIFRLDLTSEEKAIEIAAPLINKFFDKFIAKDIPYS